MFLIQRILVFLLLIGSNAFVAANDPIADHPVMDVQLPFIDGSSYECSQNAGGSYSHRMVSTRYDLDFRLPRGTPVVAASSGKVTIYNDLKNFGKHIKIDHGAGYWTMYGHLSSFIIKNDDYVLAGQPIAYSGNTGNSTGPHLHFGVHIGDGHSGTSQPMNVYALDRVLNKVGYLATGPTKSGFICDSFRKYESRPIGKTFGDYSCKKQISNFGYLCWENNPVDCMDGKNHVRYFQNNEHAWRSESGSNTWSFCSKDTDEYVKPLAFLSGGFGIGGAGPGTETAITDPIQQNPPDLITTKVWLTTPWQKEVYRYGSPEIMKMHAQFKNIGTGNANKEIEVHFYLSRGYKEDPHTEWKRVGTDFIQPENIKFDAATPKEEEEGIELWRDIPIPAPGVYNIVACIDHVKDDHNNGGAIPEKHESNNCSTEAVFVVTADGQAVNKPNIDFVAHSLQFLQVPIYQGDQARLGGYILNQGLNAPQAGIRSSYSVICQGTARTYLTDDGTDAAELTPNVSNWEQNNASVTMPNVVGACTAYLCSDYQNSVQEGNEDNNCASLSFNLQPRPVLKLVITQFQDQKGCCTTNTGEYIYPDIWIRNDGTATPSTNVRVLYQVSSPIGTGGGYVNIGYGTITPGELLPGSTDEDYMDDGRWRIPNSDGWKNQWHQVRACVNPLGNEPTGGSDDVCATYQRFSKR